MQLENRQYIYFLTSFRHNVENITAVFYLEGRYLLAKLASQRLVS